MAKAPTMSIAIVGGGPVGLEAALYAQTLGYPVKLFERGRIGEHMQRWGHVRLYSTFSMNSTLLGRQTILDTQPRHAFPGEQECILGRQHVEQYLKPLAESDKLRNVITQAQVVQIARRGFLKTEAPGDTRRGQQPFCLLLRDANGRERVEDAQIVLDCTGTYGQHRWLGEGGMPALGELAAQAQIVYGLEDVLGEQRNRYIGKKILVLGSGYSAATTVSSLADLAEEHQDTWVIWAARTTRTQPIRRIPNDPLKERDRIAMRANNLATRREGNVEFHNQTVVDGLEFLGPEQGFRVQARKAGKPILWEVERIIAQIGYTPDTEIYRELQVHECYASMAPMKLAAALIAHGGGDCMTMGAQGPETMRNPEPNFYILGAKSYGRTSQFLMKTGFDQVREVFTLITGQSGLDLYKNPRGKS